MTYTLGLAGGGMGMAGLPGAVAVKLLSQPALG